MTRRVTLLLIDRQDGWPNSWRVVLIGREVSSLDESGDALNPQLQTAESIHGRIRFAGRGAAIRRLLNFKSAMADTNPRRRLLVVNKELQKRIVLAVILVPTIGLAMSTMVVAVFCRRLLTESLSVDAELPSLVPLLVSVLLFFTVCSLVMAVQGLRFSHRIAGPAYRLCKSLEQIREGDIDFRVTLRRGDYLTEVADELNATLDWLNENPPESVVRVGGGDIVEVDADEDIGGGSDSSIAAAPAVAVSQS